MREAVEYAVGIFHGSIMAIQSEGGGGKCGRNLSFRRGSDAIYPEENPRERRDVLSNVLSIYPGGIPPVFSFRFRATEQRKVRDGVLVEQNGEAIEETGEEGGGKEDATAARRCKRDWRVCRAAYALRAWVRSKKRRETAVT